jgi:hypothetical protein
MTLPLHVLTLLRHLQGAGADYALPEDDAIDSKPVGAV